MDIKEMQKRVDVWIKENTPGYWNPSNMILRLVEEVGELAREINHRFGEKPKKDTEDYKEVGDEIADIMYTLICIANSLNIDLEDAFSRVMKKYEKRDKQRHK